MKRTFKYLLNMLLAAAVSMTAVACGGNSGGGGDDPDNPNPPTNPTQPMTTVAYTPTDETFANPERGYYSQVTVNDITKEVPLATLQNINKKGNTLILLMCYLTGYNESDLPAEGIKMLGTDFANIRTAGMKAIIRFAYTDSGSGKDASMDIIYRHLDQLKDVITDNKDVIACAQAGFIGAWGEWHSSSHQLATASGFKRLLDKWLAVLPEDRCVQVRTPHYKMDYLHSQNPLAASVAHTNAPQARIAHHNDAFMSDNTNMGTYLDPTAERSYLATDGLYLPVGGETCLPSATAAVSKGTAAVAEMQTLHWSFLNDLYDTKVLDSWKKDGVGTTIANGLGYRIQLLKGSFSSKHSAGSDLTMSLTLQNRGFAAMYNPRNVELVLVSADGKTEYAATLPVDPRTWLPGKAVTISQTVALPSDIADGSYKLYLALPDACASLASNPKYAVRVANKNVWDAEKGRNNLGATIVVSKSSGMAASKSSVKFVKR